MSTAREMYSRAGWTIGFALILYYVNRTDYPAPAAKLAGVIVLIGLGFVAAGYALHWLNTVGQARVREQILDLAQLDGSERVLNPCCRTGELAIAAARRMKSGKVIGLGETEANETARAAAKAQGLSDKVLRFESGDLGKLSYPDANFEVVLSSGALQELTPLAAQRAVAEMVRVLKPGGRLLLHEMGLDPAFIRQLEPLDGVDVTVTSHSTALPLGLGGNIAAMRMPLP